MVGENRLRWEHFGVPVGRKPEPEGKKLLCLSQELVINML